MKMPAGKRNNLLKSLSQVHQPPGGHSPELPITWRNSKLKVTVSVTDVPVLYAILSIYNVYKSNYVLYSCMLKGNSRLNLIC